MLVQIIIPNYNGEKLLGPCLESIFRQSFKDYEVLVVDDASSDSSLELLKKYPVRVIENKENLGFAGSVNVGLQNSRGKYSLLLNNDVILCEDFLENIVEAMNSPEIFSVSPKMLRYKEPGLIDDAGDDYTVFGWIYKRGDGFPRRFFDKRASVFSACAGAGLYRSDVFNEIGLFDEAHYAYLEDVDVGWRARIQGYENIYEPEAVCYHIGSATLAGGQRYSYQKVELSARNNIYIIYKNMPDWQIALNFPFLLVGFGVKYLYFRHLGYDNAYVSGLKAGIEGCKNLKRTKKGSLKNYLKIQAKMTAETALYAGLQVAKRFLTEIDVVHQKLGGPVDA